MSGPRKASTKSGRTIGRTYRGQLHDRAPIAARQRHLLGARPALDATLGGECLMAGRKLLREDQTHREAFRRVTAIASPPVRSKARLQIICLPDIDGVIRAVQHVDVEGHHEPRTPLILRVPPDEREDRSGTDTQARLQAPRWAGSASTTRTWASSAAPRTASTRARCWRCRRLNATNRRSSPSRSW